MRRSSKQHSKCFEFLESSLDSSIERQRLIVIMSKSVRCQAGALLLLLFCLPLSLRAQLSKEDHEAAGRMISGTLYLRLQAPQKYGMGEWAPYSVGMLEASPTGASTERRLADPLKKLPWNGYHLKNEEVYWGYLANTPVNHCKLASERGALVVWCDRVDPNTDVSVDFIDIKTLDDFTKAFNLTFSKAPLQDEHPDWPEAVRKGIGAGKLVTGMTVEQARIVVGAPRSVAAGEEGGVKTEMWTLRQDPGQVLGWSKKHGAWLKVATQTGFPLSISFKDGKLLSVGGAGVAARKIDSEGNAWLDAHKLDAPEIDISGEWHEHAWGTMTLRQGEDNGEVVGKSPEYDLIGVVSGKKAYLIFATKGKTEYSAIVSMTSDGRLEGKYEGGIIKDESKGRSIELKKR
jgi:hypothetical protein